MSVALAILGIAISETLATDYVAGDYQGWASGKKFLVGDRIIKFKQFLLQENFQIDFFFFKLKFKTISASNSISVIILQDDACFFVQNFPNGLRCHVSPPPIFKHRQGFHNVIQVNNDSFQACKAPADAVVLTSGNDIIKLNVMGTKQYICGIGKHCTNGNMKLSINVSAKNSGTPAPPRASGDPCH